MLLLHFQIINIVKVVLQHVSTCCSGAVTQAACVMILQVCLVCNSTHIPYLPLPNTLNGDKVPCCKGKHAAKMPLTESMQEVFPPIACHDQCSQYSLAQSPFLACSYMLDIIIAVNIAYHSPAFFLAAMSLAAEDEDPGSPMMPSPGYGTHMHSTRRGQYGSSATPRHFPHAAYASSDPMAAIAHSLLGGSRFDEESSHALLASLRADLAAAGGMAVASSAAMGNGHQDMSYEALTNLEDVKLTAAPELLATMPLDMCLKGSAWDQKVCCMHNCFVAALLA